MIALPYLAAVDVTGTDARDFLHAQLSADIRGLAAGRCVTACLCNPQGRVLDHIVVRASEDDGFTLLLHAGRVRAFVDRLRLFVLRSRVEFAPREGMSVLAASAGARATAPDDAPAAADAREAFEGPGGLRYLLGESPGADSEADSEAGACWRFGELERGMLWLDEALSGQYLPQMLGLDTVGSVNFRKGCYPGQEVVARARYLGKVKRLPAVAIVTGEPPAGTGEAVSLVGPDGDGETSAEVAAVASCAGRTALFLVVRDRDATTPGAVVVDGRSHPLQGWATM